MVSPARLFEAWSTGAIKCRADACLVLAGNRGLQCNLSCVSQAFLSEPHGPKQCVGMAPLPRGRGAAPAPPPPAASEAADSGSRRLIRRGSSLASLRDTATPGSGSGSVPPSQGTALVAAPNPAPAVFAPTNPMPGATMPLPLHVCTCHTVDRGDVRRGCSRNARLGLSVSTEVGRWGDCGHRGHRAREAETPNGRRQRPRRKQQG